MALVDEIIGDEHEQDERGFDPLVHRDLAEPAKLEDEALAAALREAVAFLENHSDRLELPDNPTRFALLAIHVQHLFTQAADTDTRLARIEALIEEADRP